MKIRLISISINIGFLCCLFMLPEGVSYSVILIVLQVLSAICAGVALFAPWTYEDEPIKDQLHFHSYLNLLSVFPILLVNFWYFFFPQTKWLNGLILAAFCVLLLLCLIREKDRKKRRVYCALLVSAVMLLIFSLTTGKAPELLSK